MSDAARVPGQFLNTDAYVTALAWSGGTVAFALGDGTLRLTDAAGERSIAAHDGAPLAIAAYGDGFVSGGDDGRVMRIGADGAAGELHRARGKFIERVAVSTASGALVFTAGRDANVIAKPGAAAKTLTHPSAVTGVAFDPKGKRIVCSHYNGVSLWWLAAESATPTVLEWKGSHTGVWWHPGGDFIMTAMQENALHGWRLSDKQHMRMAGYPSKTRSMGFFAKGKWLATAGAEAVICWPFDGKGPMGKSAREVGPQGSICTFVAPHPDRAMIASGHADGAVWLTRFEDDRTSCIRIPGEGPVSALGWSPDGAKLAFGCEDGAAGVLDFSAALR